MATEDREFRELFDQIGLTSESTSEPAALSPSEQVRAEEALAEILSSSNGRGASAPPKRATGRALGVVLVTAAAAVVTAVFLVPRIGEHAPRPQEVNLAALPGLGSDDPVSATQPASSSLIELAAVARSDSRGRDTEQSAFLQWAADSNEVERVEQFILPDGSVRTVTSVQGSPRDEIFWNKFTTVRSQHVSSDVTVPLSSEFRFTARTASVGDTRRTLLQLSGCAAESANCLLLGVVDAHRRGASDSVGSAMIWEALSGVSGLRSLGTVDDRLDRRVVAITAAPDSGGSQSFVFIDPSTGRYMGFEQTQRTTQHDGGATEAVRVVSILDLGDQFGAPAP